MHCSSVKFFYDTKRCCDCRLVTPESIEFLDTSSLIQSSRHPDNKLMTLSKFSLNAAEDHALV